MERSPAYPAVYSLAFFAAFSVSVVMLATDKNLQTNFGSLSTGYYLHWYAVLVTALVDLVGGLLLLAVRTRTMYKVGIVGSGLLALLIVGDVFTYAQVGFASAASFADYLYGITYYGGDIRYLYDLLVAVYLGTFVLGLVGLYLTRARPSASRDPGPASSDRS